MKSPKEIIEEAIERDGRSQKDIGKACGVSQPMISAIKNGTREGKRDKVNALLKELKLTFQEVYGDEVADDRGSTLEETNTFGTRSRMVPIISWIQAGQWMEIEDTFHPGDSDDQVIGDNVSRSAFALRVVGDSMEPEFREGELVIVDPEVAVNSGDFIVAKLKDTNGDKGEATLKRFIKDGGRVYLKPLNSDYRIMDMTDREFCVVGCVVQKAKKYR